MPHEPAAPARRAVTALDQRLETVTGHDIDTLWAHQDRGVLDASDARLVDEHRELTRAETSVTFYRTLLHRLTSGEFPVDTAWFDRIDRTVRHLDEAAAARDTATRRLLATLEPIEAAAAAAPAPGEEPISDADQAALLVIAGGAKLYERLLTGRLAVTAASGVRMPYTDLQRLEGAGLVYRDTRHPLHAGQPLTLTTAGRAALAAARRTAATSVPKATARPGAWPSMPAHRR
ncbi:hypothetical protein ACIQNU_42205 [Streptomyces sp. NPDC091292]|uniref:hypothetical protein n=1 Tax=Streptomyces sp. NPDC091292 TaxID=3365991 RepID=UPI003802C96D